MDPAAAGSMLKRMVLAPGGKGKNADAVIRGKCGCGERTGAPKSL